MRTIRRGAIAFFILVAIIWMRNLPSGVDVIETEDGTRPVPLPKRCPMHPAVDHGIVNTGRRALVFYTFTSHDNAHDRQVELDNYLFFQTHGVFTPNTPTALFSAVDYIILRSDLKRPATNSSADAPVNADVHECGTKKIKNVRFVETPRGPCDHCSIGRTIIALGGAEAVAREYEFVVSINSGARGPFFTEAPHNANRTSPVTWIDHFALGGEKVYTGAILSSSGGVAMGMARPFLHGFALGIPSSALVTLHAVLLAGCMEKKVPGLWAGIIHSWALDFHRHVSEEEVNRVLQAVNKSTPPPVRIKAGDTESVRIAKKEVEAIIARGLHLHKNVVVKFNLAELKKGSQPDPWDDKTRCVVRSEVQLLKTMLDTPLPPSATPGSSDRRLIQRPHLTAAQEAQLSPTLSGYLHRGHFFARSWDHDTTLATMDHAHMVLSRPQDSLYKMDPCRVMFLKFGGTGWRMRWIPNGTVARVQELSLLQSPPSRTCNAFARAAFVQALQCSSPRQLPPLF